MRSARNADMIFRMNLLRMASIFLLTLLSALGQTAPAPKSAPKTAAAAPAASGDLIDVNHATAAELKALPGIGDAYSLAIVKHRPYKNKTQLRSMGVIPPATYEKIKDKIIAKQ